MFHTFFFNKESTIISLNSIIHEKEDCNDQATVSTKKEVFLASLKSYEVCNVSAIYEEFTFVFLYDSISP